MELEAVYDGERLHFRIPVRLKRTPVDVVVRVPDDAVDLRPAHDLPQEVVERAQAMRRRLDALLHAPFPLEEQLPVVTEKQRERMVAYEAREER